MRVTPDICIDESELEESFVRSTGPGGQHVNTSSTAVQLRFDARHSPSLPDSVRARLLRIAGNRATAEGEIVIESREHRSQQQNRQEARQRLADLIRRATVRPKRRRPTRPTRASQERRVEQKKRRGQKKRMRKGPKAEDW